MQSAELDRDLASATAAHQRLLASIDDLTDAEAWQPSVLKGWTVGHVLTHLARNADSYVRLMKGAEQGEVVDQYVGGSAGRAADIEAGAHRTAELLVADLRMSIWKLEQAWDHATDRAWLGTGRSPVGEFPIAILPFRRLVETEIHHFDLGLGYGIDDWPPDFVRGESKRLVGLWASRQPMGLTELPAAVLALSPNQRLAWLAGRRDVDGVEPAGVFG